MEALTLDASVRYLRFLLPGWGNRIAGRFGIWRSNGWELGDRITERLSIRRSNNRTTEN